LLFEISKKRALEVSYCHQSEVYSKVGLPTLTMVEAGFGRNGRVTGYQIVSAALSYYFQMLGAFSCLLSNLSILGAAQSACTFGGALLAP